MKLSRLLTLVFVPVILMEGAIPKTGLSQASPDTLNVFFVGNSYTYFNNLPRLVEGISLSSDGPIVRPGFHTHGGASLQAHLEDGHLSEIFGSEEPISLAWDYVIMNEQSALGASEEDKLAGRLADSDVFHTSVRTLDKMIRVNDARPLLYMTWAREAYPDTIEDISQAYDDIGNELGIPVAPVGLAWARVRNERPDIMLFLPDGAHPSINGSYLAACVIYAQITGVTPVGADNYLSGKPWDILGIRDSGARTVLAFLSPEMAQYLQTTAWDVVSSRLE